MGGGLVTLAIALVPQLPKILEWVDKQIDKKRAFAREQRKEKAEIAARLIQILQGVVHGNATIEKDVKGVVHSNTTIEKDVAWLVEYLKKK